MYKNQKQALEDNLIVTIASETLKVVFEQYVRIWKLDT